MACSIVAVWVIPQPASSTDPPQTIESDDPLVLPTGTWTSVNTSNASGGSYLYASSPNDTLTLDFYGTSIEVIYVEDPNFGSFTVEIDNTAVRTVTATGTSTVFDVHSVFEYLDDGPHTLRITGIQGTVAIDAFYGTTSLMPIFNVDFDTNHYGDWLDASFVFENLEDGQDGQVLRLSPLLPSIRPLIGGTPDLVWETDLWLESGVTIFSTHESAAGTYWLRITDGGEISLSRTDVELASATVPDFSTETWHHLRFANLFGRLTVTFDGVNLIDVTDANPLPYGTVSIWHDIEQIEDAVLLDNVRILVPHVDYEARTHTTNMRQSAVTTPLPIEAVPSEPEMSMQESQDAGQIVYRCNYPNKPFCIRPGDGTNSYSTLPITPNPPYFSVGHRSPVWSPDGQMIAYIYDAYSPQYGYVALIGGIERDGSNGWQFANVAAPSSEPIPQYYSGLAWSPDDNYFAFHLDKAGANHDVVYRDRLDCGTCPLTNLTPTATTINNQHPTWSPSSSQIAFHSNRDGDDKIFIVDVVSQAVTAVDADQPAGVTYSEPDWSPDGLKFAVKRTENNQSSIYIMDINGQNLEQVTFPSVDEDDSYPEWSPDGSRILFTRYSPTLGNYYLHTVELATGSDNLMTIGTQGRWWGDPCPSGQQESTCQQEDEDWEIELIVDYGPLPLNPHGQFNPDSLPSGEEPDIVPLYDNLIFNVSVTNQSGDTLTVTRVTLAWEWTPPPFFQEWSNYEGTEPFLYPLKYGQPGGIGTPKGYCNDFELDGNGEYVAQSGCIINGGIPPGTTYDDNIPHQFCPNLENPDLCGLVWWVPNQVVQDGNILQLDPRVVFELLRSGQLKAQIIVEATDGNGTSLVSDPEDVSFKVPVTRIFEENGNVDKIKSAIFWIVYNESSEGQFENPAFFDGDFPSGIRSSSFLRSDPYCTDSNEIPANEEESEQTKIEGEPTNGWDADILYFYHCTPDIEDLSDKEQHFDPYYASLMTQVVLNALLNRERQSGTDKFFSWIVVSSDVFVNIGTEEEPVLVRQMSYYLNDDEEDDELYSSNFLYMNQPAYPVWGETCTGTDLREAMVMDRDMNTLVEERFNYFHDYLTCRLQDGDPDFQTVYDWLWPIVDSTVDEFIANLEDQTYYPIRGAVFVKAANRDGNSIGVGVCQGGIVGATCYDPNNISQSDISTVYNNYISGYYLRDNPETDPPEIEGYTPEGTPTILRPVLMLECQTVDCIVGGSRNGLYKWLTISYQLPANGPDARNIPR